MKKTILWALLCALLLSGCGPSAPEEKEEAAGEEKLKIVTTVFPAYDFARAAAGDGAEVQLLLPPGAESHSYEPTPADILAVQNCDLFLCLGGEAESWVNTILDAVELQGCAMKMVDYVDLLEEMTVEGMEEGEEHHHEDHGLGQLVEMDEHIWTDPENAAILTRAVGEKLGELDPENAPSYRENAERYAGELDALDEDFAAFFDSLPSRTIIFGDRFPLRYFAEAYDLRYYAAFPGCSKQTEPSAATIAFLTEKVQEEGVSTIFYIEFSNHLVADSIAESTGTKTAMFHTCHNISPEDLNSGKTYLSIMRENLETLKQNMP